MQRDVSLQTTVKEAMMRRLVVLALVLGLVAPTLWAGELAGVVLDDEIMVDDTGLKLNGMGLRKKLWVKVYVAGLYLETPTADGDTAAESQQVKRMVMHFQTNKAKKGKMDSAWQEGFENNAPDMAAIADRVQVFKGYFGDMKDGDVVEMTLVPGAGTKVTINGSTKGTIEGDDFAEALVRVWVGDSPPSDDFKAGLLGG
jgi:hypothetical protein